VLIIADYTYTPTKLDGAFAESWQRKCQMDSLICVTQAWSQQRPSCFAGNNEMGEGFQTLRPRGFAGPLLLGNWCPPRPNWSGKGLSRPNNEQSAWPRSCGSWGWIPIPCKGERRTGND
jgi:hypothetical protein